MTENLAIKTLSQHKTFKITPIICLIHQDWAGTTSDLLFTCVFPSQGLFPASYGSLLKLEDVLYVSLGKTDALG